MNFFPALDKSYKFLVYIGIAMIIYGYITIEAQSDTKKEHRIKYQSKVKYVELEHNNLVRDINEELDVFFLQYSIPRPINDIDSIINILNMIANKKPNNIIQSYLDTSYCVKEKIEKLFIRKIELGKLIELIDEKSLHGGVLLLVGYFLLVIGLYTWISRETIEKNLLKRKSLDLPTFSDKCQSCGKRFDSMVHYGTETLSKKNYHFCSECYRNGYFTEPNMTLNGMKIKIKREFIKKKKSRWVIYRYLQQISNLERWK